MSYWRSGDAVEGLAVMNGVPQRFTWRGQVHEVSAIANVWRIDDAWWVRHESGLSNSSERRKDKENLLFH